MSNQEENISVNVITEESISCVVEEESLSVTIRDETIDVTLAEAVNYYEGGGADLTVQNLDGTKVSTLISKIKLDQETGISVTDNSIPGEVTIGLGSSFKTWLVEGEDPLVAEGEDTVELIAGDNITLKTHPDQCQ